MLLLPALIGCTIDTGLNPESPDNNAAGIIAVTPATLSLEAPLGELATGSVWVENIGNATLTLTAAEILDSTRFTVASLESSSLAPGDQAELVVSFEAVTLEESAAMRIYSSDPDSPEVDVTLFGAALTPLLTIEPDPISFGSRTTDCVWEQPVSLINDGSADLQIDTALLIGSVYSLADTLQTTLAPGESIESTISFAPQEPGTIEGLMTVASSDPSGDITALITGTGADPALTEQLFVQGAEILDAVDILFYIDQSGSMGDDKIRLEVAAETFMADLSMTAADYQVMVVTGDLGCHNGTIITGSTADPVNSFVDALDGQPGGFTEAGLSVVLSALSESGPGGCNAGFLRDDVPLSLILVSDEPEQSPNGWEKTLAEVLAVAPEAIVSAIAGDYPSGCDTADAGFGYFEAVEATGGVYLSICAEDWSPHLESISEVSTQIDGEITDTFLLADYPEPETIVVEVNESVVSDWTYDPQSNAIIFGEQPENGASILVTFTTGCG